MKTPPVRRTPCAIEQFEAAGLIMSRARQCYQDACKYLKEVRRLFARRARGRCWQHYVSQLRAWHSTLRAFQQELAKAKL